MKAPRDHAVICDDYVKGPMTKADADKWCERLNPGGDLASPIFGISVCKLHHEVILVADLPPGRQLRK